MSGATRPPRVGAFLYPWDIAGDPDAPYRLRDLGIQSVALAAAYHSVRALTPRHPRHRIVTAEHAAVYYPPDEARWRGRALRPYRQSWVPQRDPYGVAARQLAAAGLAVHSWVVLAHNSRMGLEHPQTVVRNAYGDRYPWAPCIARPEAVEYCATLAAEAAVRADTAGTELESCGWYGLAHLHAHDKISGVELGGAGQYLMSLCFCPRCESAYTAAGAPGTAAAVRAALEPLWRANGALDGSGEARGGRERSEWEQVERLLGPKLARLTLAHRTAATRAFQAACIAAVRAAAGAGFRILVHADPVSHRSGPNPGVEADWLLGAGGADGLVLPHAAIEQVGRLGQLEQVGQGVLVANLPIVAGLGQRPDLVAELGAKAVAAGATELRLHHAGIASDTDLATVADQLAAFRRSTGAPPPAVKDAASP
ncbi:hypothetical protein [Kitasatospora sp. GAS1066B]|uniref:hypothetical protein n=1 Tax=Kitasatospora sp. GAS1066B TaxID=3156271 RepID=UPI003512D37D